MERKKQRKGVTGAPTQKKRSSQKSQIQSHSTWWFAGVTVTLTVLIASVLLFQYGGSSSLGANNGRDTTTQPDSAAKKMTASALESSEDKKTTDTVTYDKYIDLAAAKQWSPVDPLEKLLSIAITYNQMFDLLPKDGTDTDPSTSSAHLLQMVEKEFKFVLNVLLHSKARSSRQKAPFFSLTVPPHVTAVSASSALSDSVSEQYIDLTPVVFEAIAGVHRGIVRAGKQTLQNYSSIFSSSSVDEKEHGRGVGVVVTRQQAEAASMKYQYGLVFALFRLVNQVTTPSRLTLSSESPSPTSAVAFPHLFIDLEQGLGRYGQGALGSAVSLGLYRLFEPLVMLGSDCAEALIAAVRNSDDLALSMLLHLAHSPSPPSSSSSSSQSKGGIRRLRARDLTQALELARELQFPHLASRLQEALHPAMKEDETRTQRAPAVPFFNDFLSTQASASSGDKGTAGEERRDCYAVTAAEQDLGGGYLRSSLTPKDTSTTTMKGLDEVEDKDTGTDIDKEDKETDKATVGLAQPQPLSHQCDVDVLHISDLNLTTVTDHYFRRGRPLVMRGLLDGAIAGGGWSRDAMKQLDRSIKVTPNFIPYGEQLSRSEVWQEVVVVVVLGGNQKQCH